MPPSIPLSNSDKGVVVITTAQLRWSTIPQKQFIIITNTDKFGNFFQGLHLQKINTLSYFKFHCPSVHVKGKKGKTKLEKQTCKHCKLYHSTIEAKKMHQQKCKAEINQDVKKEKRHDEEEDSDVPEQNKQEEDEPEKYGKTG